MTRPCTAIAVATTALIRIAFPVALATTWTVPEPVIPELDRLVNKDQRISLQLDHVPAAKALNAIADAGGLRVSMKGPQNCCWVDLKLTDVPLRRALELLAAQTDARYEAVGGHDLNVWLPETPKGMDKDGITTPVLVNRAEPVYPDDARKARVQGEVLVKAVIRWDGTVGHTRVVRGVEGWPSLDKAAVAAVRKRTFEPAMKRGEPVAIFFMIKVSFRVS